MFIQEEIYKIVVFYYPVAEIGGLAYVWLSLHNKTAAHNIRAYNKYLRKGFRRIVREVKSK